MMATYGPRTAESTASTIGTPQKKTRSIKACFDRRQCATNSIPSLHLHPTHRHSARERMEQPAWLALSKSQPCALEPPQVGPAAAGTSGGETTTCGNLLFERFADAAHFG